MRRASLDGVVSGTPTDRKDTTLWTSSAANSLICSGSDPKQVTTLPKVFRLWRSCFAGDRYLADVEA
jgi:hypothetical protein